MSNIGGSRREFIKLGSAAALSASLVNAGLPDQNIAKAMINTAFEPKQPQVGLIGTGGRGTNLLENLLAADVQIKALCDIIASKAEHAHQFHHIERHDPFAVGLVWRVAGWFVGVTITTQVRTDHGIVSL